MLSYVSDIIGRRPVILGALVLSVISILGAAFATSFTVFAVCYFFAGCFLFGYETEVYLYISEISGNNVDILAVRFNTYSIQMLTMVWAGTPIFLPLLSMIPTWRICFFVFSGIWLVTVPFAYCCVLESPRFLLSRKCFSQVRAIFRQISITNRRPPYNFRLSE